MVLGYGGTLRPDLNHGSGWLATDDHAVIPPLMGEIVDPLLTEAALRLSIELTPGGRGISPLRYA